MGGRGGYIEKLAEEVPEIAGIDFLESDGPAKAPSIDRRGAIDFLSLSN